MTYLSDALRREADAGLDPTGIKVAAANAIDRLTIDLARASGQSETVVAVAEGLRGPQIAVSGAHSGRNAVTP